MSYKSVHATIQALSALGVCVYPVYLYTYSAIVPNGYVITPVTTAPDGTAQLTVSLGPPIGCPTTTTVPSVLGLDIIQAQEILTDALCSVGTITYAISSSVPAGSVISQSPVGGPITFDNAWITFDNPNYTFDMSQGATIALYGIVTLVVSSGPPIVYPNTTDIIVPVAS